MRVRSLMTAPPVCVRPDSSVQEIVRLMISNRIGSLPVVDSDWRVLGVITETDLFPRTRCVPFSTVQAPSLFDLWASPDNMPSVYARTRQRTAAEVMTASPVCVDAGADVSEALQVMIETKLKHIPVIDKGRLVGILTRHDVLRAFC